MKTYDEIDDPFTHFKPWYRSDGKPINDNNLFKNIFTKRIAIWCTFCFIIGLSAGFYFN